MTSHVTSVEGRAEAYGMPYFVPRCDCGWRGEPKSMDGRGYRSAQRAAAKHRKDRS